MESMVKFWTLCVGQFILIPVKSARRRQCSQQQMADKLAPPVVEKLHSSLRAMMKLKKTTRKRCHYNYTAHKMPQIIIPLIYF